MDAVPSESSLKYGRASVVGSGYRPSYTAGGRRRESSSHDEAFDQSIRFGDEVSFSQRGGGIGKSAHKSMVDIFLAPEDADPISVAGMQTTERGSRLKNCAFYACIIIVIAIIMISVPKSWGGGSSDNDNSSVEATSAANSTVAPTAAEASPTSAPVAGEEVAEEEELVEGESGAITKAPKEDQEEDANDDDDGANRYQAIHEYILENLVSTEDVIGEGLSPQNQAIAWLAFDDDAEMDIPGYYPKKHNSGTEEEQGVQLLQRYALVVLYFAMEKGYRPEEDAVSDSAAEDNRNQFDVDWVKGMESVCKWHGVTCNDNQLVTTLNLTRTMLKGSMVPEVFSQFALPEMIALDFSNNSFDGHLPRYEELPSTNSKLQHLDLQHNHLELSLEHLPKQLQALTHLDLTGNKFSGTLPDDDAWVRMEDLVTLKLSGNNLHGPLPTEIGVLDNLEWLQLDGNELDSTIPEDWSAMTKLHTLKMAHNKLEGPLPEFLADFPLTHISLQDNLLTGEIPTVLGKLDELRDFHLQMNKFEGAMPDEICALVDADDSPLQTLTSDCKSELDCTCCTSCF